MNELMLLDGKNNWINLLKTNIKKSE